MPGGVRGRRLTTARRAVPTTPERRWEAITDTEIRSKYTFGARIVSDFTPGARFEQPTPDGRLLGEGAILESDPPRRLGT